MAISLLGGPERPHKKMKHSRKLWNIGKITKIVGGKAYRLVSLPEIKSGTSGWNLYKNRFQIILALSDFTWFLDIVLLIYKLFFWTLY